MAHSTPEGTSGGALNIDERIRLLDQLVTSELSPTTRDRYRQLCDLRLDRDGVQWERLAAAVARHFPSLQKVIALTWSHVIEVPQEDLERCCEDLR